MSRWRIARCAVLPIALVAIMAYAHSVAAHPLHTSLAELVYDPGAREIRISIRVFVDDLTKASDAYFRSHQIPARIETVPGRTPMSTRLPVIEYARASFAIADRGGHPVYLESCGGKPVGDLMWLCFRARAPDGPVGFRVAHRVLFDLYADQINIVQASYGGKRVSLLFTGDDGFKRLD